MKKIQIIKDAEINKALNKIDRQYLLGDLQRMQDLKYIHDDQLAMGLITAQAFSRG